MRKYQKYSLSQCSEHMTNCWSSAAQQRSAQCANAICLSDVDQPPANNATILAPV